MRVRLLGTAAGGGFPQWNCNCANCRGLRSGAVRAQARTQACVAISADNERWFLLNASPDLRQQIESFPALLPVGPMTRGTAIEGVLLTNADLDHTLGLLLLREGSRLPVHATARVRRTLSVGIGIASVLDAYCGLEWREPPSELAPLRTREGSPSGLLYAGIPVPGKPPRYLRDDDAPGDCIAYRFMDERTGGRLSFMPQLAGWDRRLMSLLEDCDALLLDGTFWSEDEMRRTGAGEVGAFEMGHLPVGEAHGTLARIATLPIGRRIYLHINNTNPMLIEDSPERAAVAAAGVEVGCDGLEFEL